MWLRSQARAGRPNRTLRARLSLVYGGLFLLCGTVLLAVTYVLFERLTDIGKGEGPPIQYPIRKYPDSALIKGAAASRAAVLHQLLASSAIALAILAVVALALGWFVAGRMLRPLRTITATARHISASNLHERLSLTGPDDELKELGDTFDELLGRLQRSWDSQRQFISNVSHELRSPLTRLRLQAELSISDDDATVDSLRSGYAAVIAAAQQQEELIAALLALAKGQRGLNQQETFDLAPLANEVLHSRRDEASSLGLRVEADIGEANVTGDPRLVEQLIGNLVENAMRYNVPGGTVQLATFIKEEGGGVLTVVNDGPLVPASDLVRLFRPFERLDPSRRQHRTGHGLGLSIVEAIATAHGAAIKARSRSEGGLAVEVAFPPPIAPALSTATPTIDSRQGRAGFDFSAAAVARTQRPTTTRVS